MSFLSVNSLKPTVRRTSSISDDEMLSLQGEFVGLGTDGENEINTEELRALLISMRIKLYLTESDINKAIKQIDQDGDGIVDFDELSSVIERFDTDGIIYKALSQRSKIRKEFIKYDKDKNGFITLDELVSIVKERTGIIISERHLERMLRETDTNHDGQINYEEFCGLMTKSFMKKRVLAKTPTKGNANDKNFTFDTKI
jgi:Ca2+-binding EF-hand superfamily protein